MKRLFALAAHPRPVRPRAARLADQLCARPDRRSTIWPAPNAWRAPIRLAPPPRPNSQPRSPGLPAPLWRAKNLDQADALAAEANKMASRFLIGQKLDDDPWLPTAVGASIEIHAQVLAARGERPEAIAYLQGQLKQFAGTSLPERIRKNINLLSLEGKPAPPLDLRCPVARRQARPRSPRCADIPSCSSSGRTGAATAKPKSPSSPTCSGPSRRKGWR